MKVKISVPHIVPKVWGGLSFWLYENCAPLCSANKSWKHLSRGTEVENQVCRKQLGFVNFSLPNYFCLVQLQIRLLPCHLILRPIKGIIIFLMTFWLFHKFSWHSKKKKIPVVSLVFRLRYLMKILLVVPVN